MQLTIGKKIGVVLALALAALVVVGALAYRATNRLISDAERNSTMLRMSAREMK